MFKQILLSSLVIIICYFLIKKLIVVFFCKLNLSKLIIKYPLNDSDKSLLVMYSSDYKLADLVLPEFAKKTVVFYTNDTWSTLNNNYIYDIINNKYFIIDKGYYYYLNDLSNYKITTSPNKIIKLFDNDKKINFI